MAVQSSWSVLQVYTPQSLSTQHCPWGTKPLLTTIEPQIKGFNNSPP